MRGVEGYWRWWQAHMQERAASTGELAPQDAVGHPQGGCFPWMSLYCSRVAPLRDNTPQPAMYCGEEVRSFARYDGGLVFADEGAIS